MIWTVRRTIGRVICSCEATPGARSESAVGEEEEERAEPEQEDDVAAVDHALREAVEVVEERELEEHRRHALSEGGLVPGGEPGEDDHPVGEHGGHDLVLRHHRGGEPARHEGGAEEQEAEVAGEERCHGEGVECVEQRGTERRRGEEPEVGEEGGEELPREQLAVAYRIREEELEGAELPLLGEEPHGEERQHEQGHQAVVEEHEAPEATRLVGAPDEHEEDDVAVEEVARETDEDGAQDGGERRATHGGELAATDAEGLGHFFPGGPSSARPLRGRRASDAPRPRRPAWPLSRPTSAFLSSRGPCGARSLRSVCSSDAPSLTPARPSPPAAWPLSRPASASDSFGGSLGACPLRGPCSGAPCSLAATRARKASSSEGSTVVSVRRPQLCVVMRAASSARTSCPGSTSTRQRVLPFATARRSTRRTFGTVPSVAASASGGADASTSTREVGRRRLARLAGRSAASTRPRCRMTTRSHM